MRPKKASKAKKESIVDEIYNKMLDGETDQDIAAFFKEKYNYSETQTEYYFGEARKKLLEVVMPVFNALMAGDTNHEIIADCAKRDIDRQQAISAIRYGYRMQAEIPIPAKEEFEPWFHSKMLFALKIAEKSEKAYPIVRVLEAMQKSMGYAQEDEQPASEYMNVEDVFRFSNKMVEYYDKDEAKNDP